MEKTFSERLRGAMNWKQGGQNWRITLQDAADRLRGKGIIQGGQKDGTLKNWYYGKSAPVPFLQNAVIKEMEEMRETAKAAIGKTLA